MSTEFRSLLEYRPNNLNREPDNSLNIRTGSRQSRNVTDDFERSVWVCESFRYVASEFRARGIRFSGVNSLVNSVIRSSQSLPCSLSSSLSHFTLQSCSLKITFLASRLPQISPTFVYLDLYVVPSNTIPDRLS